MRIACEIFTGKLAVARNDFRRLGKSQFVQPYSFIADFFQSVDDSIPIVFALARQPVFFIDKVVIGNMSRNNLFAEFSNEIDIVFFEQMVGVETYAQIVVSRYKLLNIVGISTETGTRQILDANCTAANFFRRFGKFGKTFGRNFKFRFTFVFVDGLTARVNDKSCYADL